MNKALNIIASSFVGFTLVAVLAFFVYAMCIVTSMDRWLVATMMVFSLMLIWSVHRIDKHGKTKQRD